MTKVAFGGGCHWCTEGVFQSLLGVLQVDQGWVSSEAPNHNFSEGVIVSYDPKVISLDVLVEIHLLTHASTANHSMRDKYRSAVYVFEESQKIVVAAIFKKIQIGFLKKIITQTLPFVSFKKNKEEFLNYYLKQPQAPFCKKHIEPKIEKLLKTHSKFIVSRRYKGK